MADPHPHLAPMIAVVGCDGSGKSTVAVHLLAWASAYGPTAMAHLGRQSGNVGRTLARMPFVGRWFDRLIRRKVRHVHQKLDHERTPGVLPALVISAFTLRVRRRFRRMLALRRRGFIIVTDRYPQMAVPRAYGGPNLATGLSGSGFVRWLAEREQAVYRDMVRWQPDLVLRLNVDVDTAQRRKPDHPRDQLEQKIAVTPRLSYGGAPIVDVDATRPLAEVLGVAEDACRAEFTRRGFVPRAVRS